MPVTRVPRAAIVIAVALALFGTFTVVGKAAASGISGGVEVAAAQLAKAKAVPLARNAKRLKNKPPAAYLDRVAFASVASGVPVPLGATEILPPTDIRLPGAVKFLRITGTATFAGGGTNYILWFSLDAPCATSGLGYVNRQYGSTAAQQSSTTFNYVVKPGKGVHSVRLCASAGAGTSAYSRTLVLETIAKGPTGGTSLKTIAPRPAPDRDGRPLTPH